MGFNIVSLIEIKNNHMSRLVIFIGFLILIIGKQWGARLYHSHNHINLGASYKWGTFFITAY